VQNRSSVPVALDGYALEPGGFVPFSDGTVLAPGAAQVVDVPGYHSLPNRGGRVRVTTFSGIPVACDSWGTGTCG
jgi:hypothetical protein